ncbi:MAG: response regulator [bacterium]|nr:response regulator [bacterium]
MEDSKYSILIVDDEVTNLSVLDTILSPLYRVRAARDGKAALTIARAEKPDAILLDIMMPEMDGYEVCRQLRLEPDFASVPVIFVTTRGEVPDEEDAFHSGATDYVTKPIDPKILLARLSLHLKL